jgi:hypothetical protein
MLVLTQESAKNADELSDRAIADIPAKQAEAER